MGFNQNEFMDNAMKATEQRFKDHNDAIERRIWTAPEDVPIVGLIGQMVAAHEANKGFFEEAGEVTPGMFDGLISYDCNCKPRPFREVHTMNEAKDAVSAGYKPIELEDILHERGSVPHFMGNPVASWQDVERIEEACRKFAVSARMSYHEVCNAAASVLSNTHRTEAQQDRISAAIKELANSVQVAQEKAIFGGKVSARAARRSAQSTSFTQTLKKSLNEQKGK